MQDAGYEIPDTGCKILGTERVHSSRVQGFK
jgi:hypothetical protein